MRFDSRVQGRGKSVMAAREGDGGEGREGAEGMRAPGASAQGLKPTHSQRAGPGTEHRIASASSREGDRCLQQQNEASVRRCLVQMKERCEGLEPELQHEPPQVR